MYRALAALLMVLGTPLAFLAPGESQPVRHEPHVPFVPPSYIQCFEPTKFVDGITPVHGALPAFTHDLDIPIIMITPLPLGSE